MRFDAASHMAQITAGTLFKLPTRVSTGKPNMRSYAGATYSSWIKDWGSCSRTARADINDVTVFAHRVTDRVQRHEETQTGPHDCAKTKLTTDAIKAIKRYSTESEEVEVWRPLHREEICQTLRLKAEY